MQDLAVNLKMKDSELENQIVDLKGYISIVHKMVKNVGDTMFSNEAAAKISDLQKTNVEQEKMIDVQDA